MITYTSISQKNTSLSERETYYRSLRSQVCPQVIPSEGTVLLQTCNRVELYSGGESISANVARHLFRVAAGLESALIGERAVQGQVKEAYLQAKSSGRLSAEMHKLFQTALQAGKRVRTETRIAQGAVSHALAAIEIIEKEKVSLSDSRIAIVGVNKLTSDVLKFLQNKGAQTVFLANRSREKALRLAEPFGIEVFSLTEKKDFLRRTDVLITATSAPHTIIGKEDVAPNRQLLVIDLAFPRDVDSSLAEHKGVTLYNIADVEQMVRQNIKVRQEEVKKAENIIEEEIEKLTADLNRRKQFLQRVG